MLITVQQHRDYLKCLKVINSCVNDNHIHSTCNLINNFGKLYHYNEKWVDLRNAMLDHEWKCKKGDLR